MRPETPPMWDEPPGGVERAVASWRWRLAARSWRSRLRGWRGVGLGELALDGWRPAPGERARAGGVERALASRRDAAGGPSMRPETPPMWDAPPVPLPHPGMPAASSPAPARVVRARVGVLKEWSEEGLARRFG